MESFKTSLFSLPPLPVGLAVSEVVQVIVSVLLVLLPLLLTVRIVSIHICVAWCVSVRSAAERERESKGRFTMAYIIQRKRVSFCAVGSNTHTCLIIEQEYVT